MNQLLAEEYCRFTNDIFKFIETNFERIVPAGRIDPGIFLWTKDIYKKADRLKLAGNQEDLELLVKNYFKYAVEYFKLNTPWQNVEADRRISCNALLNTMQLVVNLSVLMMFIDYEPAKKVLDVFGFEYTLQINHIHSGCELPEGFMIP
jgi:methionyl-tRNA synthetase